jgi:hypothetical protein
MSQQKNHTKSDKSQRLQNLLRPFFFQMNRNEGNKLYVQAYLGFKEAGTARARHSKR